MKYPVVLITALALVFAIIATGVISYAWFSGAGSNISLLIDSQGIDIDAKLYYSDNIDATELSEIETDYTEQNISTPRIIGNSIFYPGNTLSYKLEIVNESSVAVDIALAFSDLNKSFNQAVEAYLNYQLDDINRYLSQNSGCMLFRLKEVRYSMNGGNITDLPVQSDNLLSKDYGKEDAFIKVTGLLPANNNKLTVYFMLEAMLPSEALNKYRAYREAQATDERNSGNTAKAEAITVILDREIQSLIIDANSHEVKTSQLHIEYIKISASSPVAAD